MRAKESRCKRGVLPNGEALSNNLVNDGHVCTNIYTQTWAKTHAHAHARLVRVQTRDSWEGKENIKHPSFSSSPFKYRDCWEEQTHRNEYIKHPQAQNIMTCSNFVLVELETRVHQWAGSSQAIYCRANLICILHLLLSISVNMNVVSNCVCFYATVGRNYSLSVWVASTYASSDLCLYANEYMSIKWSISILLISSE